MRMHAVAFSVSIGLTSSARGDGVAVRVPMKASGDHVVQPIYAARGQDGPMMPIPAERCIGARELTEPRPSPDGAWVAFVAGGRGGAAIQIVPSTGGPERQLSVQPPRPGRGMGGGCFDWLPDSSGVVYVGSDGQLWLQTLDGAAARRLTDGEPAATAPAVSPDGQHVAYVVDLAAVWTVPIGGGAATLVDDGDDFCSDPAWSPDGQALAWVAWDVPAMPWDASVIVVRRPWNSGPPQRIDANQVQMQQPRFHPDGRLGFLCDADGWLNVWLAGRPAITEQAEHGGPLWGPGQRSFAWSPDGHRVAFSRNEDGFGRLCVAGVASPTAPATEGVRDVAKAVHGQLGWVGGTLVALRSGGRTPTQVVAYDTTTWERRTLAVGAYAGWEDHPALVEPELLAVPAADGATLHARRYVAPEPNGALLCWVHGGPTDQWQVTWMPRLAFWLSRGYSILVPDHRGSTGHGRDYTQALRGRWGELDADDTATLLTAMQQQGLATPARTALVGGSAGGLTVLGVLAHHGGSARCGVASYPVADIGALAEATHRFEAHYNDSLVGSGDVGAARAAERSPVQHAAALAASPLLLFHGDSDPVVPLAQSELLAERVRAAGGEVELVVYAGEGHGFRDPTNQLEEYARMEAFLDRHLLGRTPVAEPGPAQPLV
jgi:dipeptidyl aminopeptidase/acylaminoacyl peptidase